VVVKAVLRGMCPVPLGFSEGDLLSFMEKVWLILGVCVGQACRLGGAGLQWVYSERPNARGPVYFYPTLLNMHNIPLSNPPSHHPPPPPHTLLTHPQTPLSSLTSLIPPHSPSNQHPPSAHLRSENPDKYSPSNRALKCLAVSSQSMSCHGIRELMRFSRWDIMYSIWASISHCFSRGCSWWRSGWEGSAE